jgi:menaquinol-cytochrome c reductase cytochrome b subunit
MTKAFPDYPLPFEQPPYGPTVERLNITASRSFIGPYLSDFPRGGAEFGATTLSRNSAIHMLMIPTPIATPNTVHREPDAIREAKV